MSIKIWSTASHGYAVRRSLVMRRRQSWLAISMPRTGICRRTSLRRRDGTAAQPRLVTVLPLGVVHIQTRIFIHGRPAPGPGEDIRVQYRGVSPDYFVVMGIPVLRGRGFTEDDRTGQPAVVVVNQAMVRRFFPHAGYKRCTKEASHGDSHGRH